MHRILVVIVCVVALIGCKKESSKARGVDWETPNPAASETAPGAAAAPHAGQPNEEPPQGAGPIPAGMAAPDPGRAVDPSMNVKGKIAGTDKTLDLIKPGAVLFLSARPVDASGKTGNLLAVDRLVVTKLPMDFMLSEANAMVAGTRFEGKIQISARVDQDGEARTKEPGDVEGAVDATVPADNLTLTLDTIVQQPSSK